MRIARLRLQNFRCFGNEVTDIDLSDLTAFIGANGAGKTAVLMALCRMFGFPGDRRLTTADFHVPHGETFDEVEQRTLLLEARIEFPELNDENSDHSAIAECFKQLVISSPGEDPFCRVRLEGTWRKSAFPEGEIEEPIYWINTGGEEVTEENRKKMNPVDRSRIQVLYVPAVRDPSRQLRQVSGSVLSRMLRAIEWNDDVRTAIENASSAVCAAFQGEAGVQRIAEAVTGVWCEMQQFPAFASVGLQPLSARIEDLLKSTEVVFSPGEGGARHSEERLSDGLKSLFYLTMVAAVFEIEQAVRAEKTQPTQVRRIGIAHDQLRIPTLTIFAVEEAENHLGPHYLGRILAVLKRMAAAPNAQVVLTSHSPAILARIEPEHIRHFRQESSNHCSAARALELPSSENDGEAHKYIKEAVRAYPELYFASLVILGEGDSEEIAIPRIAAAHDLPLDTSFVSVVPLGGRHVNHLWRLLSSLSIPFVTLLDLDRERSGGGWGRMKYACTQLIKIGVPDEGVIQVLDRHGRVFIISDEELDRMDDWETNPGMLSEWAEALERFNVFFSAPLDLDFLMLRSFPAAYRSAATAKGPQIPKGPSAEYDERVTAAVRAVLKPKGGDGTTYSSEERDAFIWYSHLFLSRGKPSTHMVALNSVTGTTLKDSTPDVLVRFLTKMREILCPTPVRSDSHVTQS